MTPIEFLRAFYGVTGTESFSINYRIASGCAITTMEVNAAADKLGRDVEEMKQFFRDFGADESKAEEATYSLWAKERLIKFG